MAKNMVEQSPLAITFIKDGDKFVMQDRTHHPGEGIGCYGGKIEQGEKKAVAAARELKEESGLVIDPQRLRALGQVPITNRVVYVFEYPLDDGEEIAEVEGNPIPMSMDEVRKEKRLMEATRAAAAKFYS